MKKIQLNLRDEILLVNEISNLIEQSKQQVVSQINSSLTILFWQIGNHINTTIFKQKRADYGKQIVVTVSRQLELKNERNFTKITINQKRPNKQPNLLLCGIV